MNFKKILSGIMTSAVLASAVIGLNLNSNVTPAKANLGTIQVKGSDTMVNLGQAWAEAYMKKNSTMLAVTGGGSGTGIAALINGTTDICEASRPMADTEIKQAKANGNNPVEYVVAKDGVAVIVNKANSIKKVTMAQLKDIYTGKVTNWKQVGGSNQPIVLMSREANSGTYVFFQEHVMNKENYAKSALLLPSTQAIVDGVKTTKGAIGYIGLGYLDKTVKVVPVAKDTKSAYILPSEKTVLDNTYPVSRPLFLYTNDKASKDVTKYIAWIMGKDGQAIVKKNDFIPYTKKGVKK